MRRSFGFILFSACKQDTLCELDRTLTIIQYVHISRIFSSSRPGVSIINYQTASDTDIRNSLAYYGAWPTMIVWGLDRFIRLVSLVTINFGYLNPWSSQNSKRQLDAIVEVLSPRFVRVSLTRSRHFHWRPGQNAYLSLPSISTFPFESHPFTISTIDADSKSDDSTLVFLLRVQRGFTQKLLKEASSDTTYKVFVNGPYGSPPFLIGYQTVVLIAGSFFCHHTLLYSSSMYHRRFRCCLYLAAIPRYPTVNKNVHFFKLPFSYLSPIVELELARILVKRSCSFGPFVTLVWINYL